MTLDELIAKLNEIKALAGSGGIPVIVFDSASFNTIEEWSVFETYDYEGNESEEVMEYVDGVKIFIN